MIHRTKSNSSPVTLKATGQLITVVSALVTALVLAACSSAPIKRAPLVANDQYGQLSAADPTKSTDVILIPQWHLSPGLTTTNSSAGLPQEENQKAIYRQLVEWVEAGQMQTVIVEGCEGEIQDGFSDRYNGWTLGDLQKLSAEQLDRTLTHVGLKLKAKLGSKVQVLCGDKLDLVKRHQLILSDMRGLLGFKTRILQFKNEPKKRADYVSTAREILKMPADASENDVLARIDSDLSLKMVEFDDVLHQRDAVFVMKAKSAQPKRAQTEAIVIGAVHIDDLTEQLHAAQGTSVMAQPMTTQIFTPKGLKGDEADLLKQIRALISSTTMPAAGSDDAQAEPSPTRATTPSPAAPPSPAK